jgi:predicted transcriptional regulator
MSKMTPSEKFLAQIEAFLARTGMPATTFGKAVLKDPSFVFDLRRGRKPTLDICDKILKYMAKKDRAFSLQDD